MALSAKRATTKALVFFVQYAQANGGRISEMPPYEPPNPGVHHVRSWHYDMDGKYGQAVDINFGAPGISAAERAFFRKLLPVARSLGIAVIHDYSGRGVGSARTHRDHLHGDVGSVSNYGNGAFTQPKGSTCVVEAQVILHQAKKQRDNLCGNLTVTDINLLRAASAYGGRKFPLGVKRTQRVVGTKQDGDWLTKSREAHDETTEDLQVLWRRDGLYTGKIDKTWGPLMDKARKAFYAKYRL